MRIGHADDPNNRTNYMACSLICLDFTMFSAKFSNLCFAPYTACVKIHRPVT